ncbi:MAG: AEC family transporter, partial [Rubrivivax sp.]
MARLPVAWNAAAAMNNIVLLLACFGLGVLLRTSGRLPAAAPATINGFVVNVSLPSLTLLTVHGLTLQPQLALAALMPWLLFAAGAGFFYAVGRALRLERGTLGALVLTGSLANTSFVGLPMIEAWYGREYMGVGIVVDQLGSYLVLSTVGILVAGLSQGTGQRPSPQAVLRKILTFTPFVALLLALALRPLEFAPWLQSLLRRLADTLVPLALVSVGFQLRLSALRGRVGLLALGLGFKLVLGPLLMLGLLVGL